MAKRYEIGVRDVVAGTQSVVEIHDSAFGGTAKAMKGHAQGGSPILYTKQALNPRTRQDTPILKTELQIDIQIETAAHEQLLADIIGSDEDRFTLIYKIDGTEEWRGQLLPDLTKWPEDAAPYLHVQLFAKDFTNLGTSNFPDEDVTETIITTIAQCLAQTGITNDIVTYTSWTEDNITSTEDFLNQIYHRTRQLVDLNRNEDETTRIQITYGEALRRILRNYGLICTQAGGQWHIWQETAFETPTSVIVSTYNSSGVLQTTATSDISYAPASITLASQNEVTPGLKAVKNQFAHRSQTFLPRLPDFVSLGASGTDVFSFDLTYSGEEIIKITSRVTATSSTTAGTAEFRVMVQAGQYYWNGSAWATGTASPVTFPMIGGGLQNSDNDYVYSGALSITTEAVPSDATSPLVITFYGATILSDPTVAAGSTLFDSLVFDITNLSIGDANSESIIFNLTQSGNYSETYQHPPTFFGDGPAVTSASALQYTSTAANTTINSWSRRDVVGSRGFHANLMHELLDTNRKGRQLLSASIRDGYSFSPVIEHNGDYFLNIGGAYDPYNSSWSPLMLAIQVLDATDSLTNRIGGKVSVGVDSTGDMVILQDGIIKNIDETVGVNSSSILSLESDVTTNEGNISANATAILAAESDINTLESDVSANASSILTLDSRVDSNDTDISANASAVLSVESRVDDAETDISNNASAVLSLDTRVDTAEGDIASIEATAVLKVDANGRIASVALSATHDSSTIDIRADQVNFDTELMSVSNVVWIGEGVDSKEGSGRALLLGTTSGGVPYTRAQYNSTNYVQMVAVNNTSNPFLQARIGGDTVMEISAGDGLTIKHSSGDWEVSEDGGIQFKVSGSYLTRRGISWVDGATEDAKIWSQSNLLRLESIGSIVLASEASGGAELQVRQDGDVHIILNSGDHFEIQNIPTTSQIGNRVWKDASGYLRHGT